MSIPSNPSDHLLSLIEDLQQALSAQSSAWAHRVETAQKAYLAAVMGPSLTRNCRESAEWSVMDGMHENTSMLTHIEKAYEVAPDLHSSVQSHVQWMLQEVEGGIADDCRQADPTFDPASTSQGDAWDAQEKAHEKEVRRIKRKLRAVRKAAHEVQQAMADAGPIGVTAQRKKVIDTFDTQMQHIHAAATELTFCDKAQLEVAEDIAAQKQHYSTTSARSFFSSLSYSRLQDERKKIESERSHIELQLQSYFDHFSQGASKSESSKPDKVKLQLAADLKSGKYGYKQIQLMDGYIMGRGNELWAIIPDLIRIGHDVDPINFMHWQPPTEAEIHPDLVAHRRDQNATLASRLLTLLTSAGLRATVLASRTYGANKVTFKAPEDDGCAIYWVICQLYHPIDRQERRKIEKEISRIHEKFSTGNPHIALEALRAAVQEGLDIAVRLRWDSTAQPLIDTLCMRDALFTVELAEFRDKPLDPEDSITDMDDLVSKIEDCIAVLDQSKKNWTEKAAMAAQISSTTSEIKALRKDMDKLSKSSRKGGTLKRNALAAQLDSSNPQPGYCQHKGCNRKIEKYKAGCGWKLCSTCLLDCRKNNKPLPLVDGSTFTPRVAMQCLGEMRTAGVTSIPSKSAIKRQKKAMQLARVDEEHESSQEEEQLDESPKSERQVKFAKSTEALVSRMRQGLRGGAAGGSKSTKRKR